MKKVVTSIVLGALILFGLAVAQAQGLSKAETDKSTSKKLATLPPLKGHKSSLKIDIGQYSNSKLEVVVHNLAGQATEFHPDGLYFVPKTTPDKAPQRMGAAGPYEVYEGGAWKTKNKPLRVPKSSKVKVRLHVFCLDQHRASPQNGQIFSVAKKRLPKKLRKRIQTGVKKALNGKPSYGVARRAKGAVQSHIWETRNSKWIKLEGEGKQEKNRKTDHRSRQRQIHRRQVPNQQQKIKLHRNPFLQD